MSDLPGFEIAAIGKVESQVAVGLRLHTKGEGPLPQDPDARREASAARPAGARWIRDEGDG